MISKFEQDNLQDGVSSAATSRDESSLSRAGPCPGFEELKVVGVLKDHSSKFSGCTSADELKTVAQQMNGLKKLFNTLNTSCKTSLADLKYAMEQGKLAQEKKEDKAVTKERERERERSASAPLNRRAGPL